MKTTLKAAGCVLLLVAGVLVGYVVDHRQTQPAVEPVRIGPMPVVEPYREPKQLVPIQWPDDGWRNAPQPLPAPREPEMLLLPPAREAQVRAHSCRQCW